MYTLVVLPGVTPQRKIGNYLLVDSKDFTLDWCHRSIAGMQFSSVEIWASNDRDASGYALSRARYPGDVSVLLTESVWQGIESAYEAYGMDREHVASIKNQCDIVEDLNGSN